MEDPFSHVSIFKAPTKTWYFIISLIRKEKRKGEHRKIPSRFLRERREPGDKGQDKPVGTSMQKGDGCQWK